LYTGEKYKVCWVCTPLGIRGGTIKRLKLWAKYINNDKFNVTFIFSSDEKEKILRDFSKYNIKLKSIPELKNRLLMYIVGTYRLAREFKNNNYDLIHSMGIRSDILTGLASKIVGKQKILSYTAGLYPPTYNPLKKFIYKALFTLIKREIDGFISLSQYTKNNLANDCNFPKKKIYINKIGIDFEEFCVKNKRLDSSTITYGCAARLITKGRGGKGIEYLIKAFNLLNKETKVDIKLLIAGDGRLKPFLEKIVFELGLDKKIQFLGWINDISDFLNKIDVFVLPSFIEGTPRSILEAYYHYVPVIATNVGGIPEILQSGKTGFLVSPGNPAELKEKMKYFIDNPEEIITMGKKARDYVMKNHNVRFEISKLEDIYVSIINAKNESKFKIF